MKPRLTARRDPGPVKDVTLTAVSEAAAGQGEHSAWGQGLPLREVRTAATQGSRPISLTCEQFNPGLHRLRWLRGLQMAERLVQEDVSSRGIRLQEDLSGRRKQGPGPEEVETQQPFTALGKPGRLQLTFRSSSRFFLMDWGSSCILPRMASSMRIPPRSPEEMQSFQKDV